MKVKTDYVPPHSRGYITPGKEYECYNICLVGADITADHGIETSICFRDCAHLDGQDWTVIEEEE